MAKTLFLTLRTFSATGGIEKVCRIVGKALYENSIEHEGELQVCSMYDRQQDAFNNHYFPFEIFRGFAISKLNFIAETVKVGAAMDVVILSHINLLPVAWLIKKISRYTKVVLLAHGIEIWYPLSGRKRNMLQCCDAIIAVSHFTKSKIITEHHIDEKKCLILNNCLDPFLPVVFSNKKNKALLHQYGFAETDTIIMTLTRISSRERYKGYDKVIEAIALLQPKYQNIKYLIAGKYDAEEKNFLNDLINKYGLEQNVVMPGYIKDDELNDHFAMSDLYVMPSRKEGFGIVFIEAMYYGLPVIAGNIDGSTDALLDGQLGQLVDPDNIREISAAINNLFENKNAFMPDRKLLLKNFSYESYKRKLQSHLSFKTILEKAI